MYLSKVLLTGEQLRNPYEVHRALWLAFPETADHQRDFLFRIEQRTSSQLQLLMQSERQPESRDSSVNILAIKETTLMLQPDTQLRFLLIANPVKTISDEQGRLNRKGDIKKCRIPLIKEEDQKNWLKRKLEHTALLSALEIEKQLPLNFSKGKQRGKIQPYSFKGILQVQDGPELARLIEKGVGPAKAFGCGLLSLARA